MDWLDDDLACRTVADRVAMYKKHAGKKFHETYEKERDRVRLVEDTDGDGKADRATVFADGFGRAEDGIGAGRARPQGERLLHLHPRPVAAPDTKGTGTADVKQSLSTGYGVHVAFIGHDLHGLCVGPDGKLYFSIGDRGLNVKTKEGKHLFCPDSGAVLRCDLDGSNLEIFATGLRNPQELAFDDFGNLFTGDNNSDGGDQARWVHVVEGGDSGWRIGYQYGTAHARRHGAAGQPRAVERREALDAAKPRRRVHRAAARELRQRPVRASRHTPASACRTSTRATSSWRLQRRAGEQRHLLVRGQAEGGVVRGGGRAQVRLEHAGDRLRVRPGRGVLRQRLGGRLEQAARAASTRSPTRRR